jgi:uncharacterized membrane protein
MITNGRPVPSGSSGGVSLSGTIGAFLGAAVIGSGASVGSATDVLPGDIPAIVILLTVTLTGFSGCLIDSLFGATIQALYRCPRDGLLTERSAHDCGTPSALVRGRRWMTNDVVNVTSIMLATVIALLALAAA